MQILFVSHAFPPESWAGVEVYALDLAREMARLGHSVIVFTRSLAPGPAGLREEWVEGLRVLRWTRAEGRPTLRQSYQDEEAESAFVEVLQRTQPALVHFHHFLHLSAGLTQIAKARVLPVLITCHDYWALCARVQMMQPSGELCAKNRGLGCFACIQNWGQVERAERWLPRLRPLVSALEQVSRALGQPSVKLDRWTSAYRAFEMRHDFVCGMYASADLLLAPSRFLRQMLLASGHFEPERVLYSDYGLRPSSPAEAKIPATDGRLRFGFVGTLVEHKGIQVLIEALQKLADPRATLAVFGRFSPESIPFHRTLLKQSHGAAITFHGGLPNDRIAEAYRQIDVLVVPSIWYENSPITIHEALERQTPLLVSGIGGMAELVEHGQSGLHFQVGDAQDLARQMRRMLDEPELLPRLRGFRPRWKTIAENASELCGHYERLLARV